MTLFKRLDIPKCLLLSLSRSFLIRILLNTTPRLLIWKITPLRVFATAVVEHIKLGIWTKDAWLLIVYLILSLLIP